MSFLSLIIKRGRSAKAEQCGGFLVHFDRRGEVLRFEMGVAPGLAARYDIRNAEADREAPLTSVQELALKAIQHSDERVRDAAVRIGGWLNDALRLRAKGRSARGRSVEAYRDYVRAIELLLDYYDDGAEEEAEFIDEMKPSPQKSLEMLFDRVAHGGYELEITHVAPPDILARREKLETEIARLLDVAHSTFCFHDVLERIYYEGIEDPTDTFAGIITMFEGAGTHNPLVEDMQGVVAVIHDAWNYFPHESLGGRCPAERGEEKKANTNSM